MDKVDDIFRKTNKLEQIKANVDTYKTSPSLISGARVLSLDQLLAMEFPENAWLVERLVPLNGTTVLSAQPASFKTWLLLDVAIAVASGKMFLGQFDVQQCGVLVIDEENSTSNLQQWTNKLGVKNGAPIYFLSNAGFTLSEHKIKETIQVCKRFNIGLVTLDALVRMHSGDENDSKQMAQVFRLLKLFNKANITVLLVHHNRKPSKVLSLGSQEMRGSSDILAAVDCHIALVRDKRRVTLKQNKVRLAEELAPIELEVESSEEEFRFNYLGTSEPQLSKRTRTQLAITELLAKRGTLNQKQLHELLSDTSERVSPVTLRDILSRMLNSGSVIASPGIKNETLYANNPDVKS